MMMRDGRCDLPVDELHRSVDGGGIAWRRLVDDLRLELAVRELELPIALVDARDEQAAAVALEPGTT